MSAIDSATDKAAASFLAGELERLMALPLVTPDDIARWDAECAKVQAELEARFPDFGFEEEIEHFFVDSDIRQRDAGYRQRQHQIVSDYVRRLRH